MFAEPRNEFSWMRGDSIRAADDAASKYRVRLFSWWQAMIDFLIRLTPFVRNFRIRNEKAMLSVIRKYSFDIVSALKTCQDKFYENEEFNVCKGTFSLEISRQEDEVCERLNDLIAKATEELQKLGIGGFFYQPVVAQHIESGYPGHINASPGIRYWTELPLLISERVGEAVDID